MKRSRLLKICMSLAAMAVFALGTGLAVAEPWEDGSRGHGGMAHGMYGRPEEGRHLWLEKLNLSADQKDKIDQIRNDQHEAVKGAIEQLRGEHEKMREMMQGNATDAELREQHGKIRALRLTIGDARFESFLKIRAVLTKGQRKRMGKMHLEGMEPGGMRDGGPGAKDPEKN